MKRAGFLVLVAASATACIFDESDYKGGGRLDKGATAKTAEPPVPTATDTTQPTSTTTSNTPDSGLLPD